MDNREIGGSYTRLPPPGFFTRARAALAIAELLFPNDQPRRAEAAGRLDAELYDALCAGRLTGRDPDLRLPIESPDPRLPAEYRGMARALALSGCIISQADINAWLLANGVGIELACKTSEDASSELRQREMAPGPERDDAIMDTHSRFRNDGQGKHLERTAAHFGCSKTVVTRAVNRARSAQCSTEVSRSSWDPFGRR